jgi:hypothetical protein
LAASFSKSSSLTIRPDHAACAVLLLARALAARTQTPLRSPIAVAL